MSSRPLPSLTLVGTPRFRPFRVVWMLEELKDMVPSLEYAHIPAAPQSEEARASHPMGKVPSLRVHDSVEGDFTMIESAAINTWLADRYREYCPADGHLAPRPGSRCRAAYDSYVHFLMAEADSSGLWIHRKLESLGEKKAFGAVRYALLPARLQFDRAMVGVRARLEEQRASAGAGADYFLVGSCFTAADVLLVHCCDWAAGLDPDKGDGGSWLSKYKADDVFQDYLRRLRARPAYVRARRIQEESPVLE